MVWKQYNCINRLGMLIHDIPECKLSFAGKRLFILWFQVYLQTLLGGVQECFYEKKLKKKYLKCGCIYVRYEKAKWLSLGLLVMGLVVGVTGAFLQEGTVLYNILLLLTLLFLAGGVVIGVVWARCPCCGRRLFVNMLRWKSCPKCGRPLQQKLKFDPSVKK